MVMRGFFCDSNYCLWLRVCSCEHFCKGYPYSYYNAAGSCWVQCFFSFVVFMDKNMWSGSPDLIMAIITGGFTATVIFYFLFFLIYSFWRMGEPE